MKATQFDTRLSHQNDTDHLQPEEIVATCTFRSPILNSENGRKASGFCIS